MNPSIRPDDFNLLIRDRFYIKNSLVTKEKKHIEFRIVYIDKNGITKTINENAEIVIVVPESKILLTWVKVLKYIIKKDKDTSESIKKDIEEGFASVDEVDYPNEYTMWHSSWYKHNYIFLQPFYSYDGALLRLSYLISELVEDEILIEEYIEIDPEIHKYPVKIV